MSIWEQITQFLGKPATLILTAAALIGGSAALIAFLWRHYDLANRQVPKLEKQVVRLEDELQDTLQQRDELRRSIQDTEALLKAIASIPGEIRQITRDVFISYESCQRVNWMP